MKTMYSKDNITELKENEIFVFGSNLNGNHAGGAAKTAVDKFGAIQGQAIGLQGQSYAIPTLGNDMQKLSLEVIKEHISAFYDFAKQNKNLQFVVTKIGCGIAGFRLEQIRDIFLSFEREDNITLPKEFCVIQGYKGFNNDLKCRNTQYKVGKDYELEGDIKTCSRGFHFCENPFDVLSYYAPSNANGETRYCLVEGAGNISKEQNKIACSKIHIGVEIGLKGLIEAGIKFIFDKIKWEDNKANTGYRSAATNTGYQSAATNTGDESAATNTGNQSAATNTGYQSAATNTGYQSAATNTGDHSTATNTGYYSAATNTGNKSAATNTGDYSAATNTGYYSAATNTGYQSAATNTGDHSTATNTGNKSAATNTGDYSAATNTGDQSAASVSGKDSIAIVTGLYGKAKGTLDCWIVLTERGEWNGQTHPIKVVKAFKVDGKNIKENTFYTLKNKKAIEVNE